MKLSLISIEKEGFIRAAATGPIISADLPADAVNPFEAVCGENWASNRLLLDMDKAAYIDSCAIGWLISSQQRFKYANGLLIVHSVRPAVLQLLKLLKVDRVIQIAENEAAARGLLSKSNGAAA